jgi:hypothetical protein
VNGHFGAVAKIAANVLQIGFGFKTFENEN